MKNFLVEIGTEELPAKLLKQIWENFSEKLQDKLIKANFLDYIFPDSASLHPGYICHMYVTPRRLALLIPKVNFQQADRQVERRGPAINAPSAALQGFARSCNVSIDQLEKLETEQGSWMVYRYLEKGKTVFELLPKLINETLAELPITKPMRWGDSDIQFIRPIHWIMMLYGDEFISGEIMGISTTNKTYGHRFHHPGIIEITTENYEKILKKIGHVIIDFNERKKNIQEQIKTIAKEKTCRAIVPEGLLDEVTGLIEWPTALPCQFDREFLSMPREALIAAMQEHQKCFALENNQGELQPYFITISNINSKEPKEVIRGNERVMRARLADAKFFYDKDCKNKLEDNLEELKHVVFQAKAGSLYDKSHRVAELAKLIAQHCQIANPEHAYRAGLLCKTDLLSNMVGEFPELQGIMGYYYALHDNEDAEVASAIGNHYHPRFSDDTLPTNQIGCAVALADKIDTLVTIFKIGQQPTGDKDPFGLRRAALGVLRILIEKELNLNIHELINSEAVEKFILDRLPNWYADKNVTLDTLEAVLKAECHNPLDIHHRVTALQAFRQLPEASALIEANKRARNILQKTNITTIINPKLFVAVSEQQLHDIIKKITLLNASKNYAVFLTQLASTQPIISRFFEEVMVMDENEALRNNRLALLSSLRQLFLKIADISLLQI